MATSPEFECVLFDLDGTLIDTAPDMVAVLNAQLVAEKRDALLYEQVRMHVSNGSAGLITLGFPDVDDAERARLIADFLQRYERALCKETRLFPGFDSLLNTFDDENVPWGIVTNKPAYLTNPLLVALNLDERSHCIVSGDTLTQRKPDPAPLLYASTLTGTAPARTIYVGDSARDIEAGKRSGMYTIGVRYGYITADDDPDTWGANDLVNDVAELGERLVTAVGIAMAAA